MKYKVPFGFAQGRLSTPQIIAFAMICSGRDDRVGEGIQSQGLKPLYHPKIILVSGKADSSLSLRSSSE
jgi:hypothetical protein